jgi:hypothetical protein
LSREVTYTMDCPAIRGTSGRVGVPELLPLSILYVESYCANMPESAGEDPVAIWTLASARSIHDMRHTPGDSKQQRFVSVVVLWHEAGPEMLQAEFICALDVKRLTGLTGDTTASVTAALASTPWARVAESIVGFAYECTESLRMIRKRCLSVRPYYLQVYISAIVSKICCVTKSTFGGNGYARC